MSKLVGKWIMQRQTAWPQNVSYQQKAKSLPSCPFCNHFFLLTMLIKIWKYWYTGTREILGLFLFHLCLLQTRKLRPGEGKWPLRVSGSGSGQARSRDTLYHCGPPHTPQPPWLEATILYMLASPWMFWMVSPSVLISTFLVLSSDNNDFILE